MVDGGRSLDGSWACMEGILGAWVLYHLGWEDAEPWGSLVLGGLVVFHRRLI